MFQRDDYQRLGNSEVQQGTRKTGGDKEETDIDYATRV
jgi:hypothetical protein